MSLFLCLVSLSSSFQVVSVGLILVSRVSFCASFLFIYLSDAYVDPDLSPAFLIGTLKNYGWLANS